MSSKPAHDLIVDLHIHSHYSRATSPQMNIASLYKWGKIKGIHIIGTGDFTHPAWFKELQEKLEPAEPGLFRLKDEFAREQDAMIPESCRNNLIRFILTVEISNIYKRGDKVRKVHNLLIVPSFAAASKINQQLAAIGNIRSDGRPILGLDSEKLLQIMLDADPDSLFVPAHIWTPWFAMFGSKSGFDTIEEAFGTLAPHIHAIETGLSSDPFMNWRLSQLDGITLLSNSDAHSPQKLAREANIMSCQVSYNDIINGIKTNDDRFKGTIEFFPEEGKYHYDGHRACDIRCTPQETKKLNGICPKCGLPLVIGVENRVDAIADRPPEYKPASHKKVEYIIPLTEIITELKGAKAANKAVWAEYDRVIAEVGNEFDVLRLLPIEQIAGAGHERLAQAIDKMRKGDVIKDPGYDGVYGTIKVNLDEEHPQLSLGI